MLIKQRKTLPKERSDALAAPLPPYMNYPAPRLGTARQSLDPAQGDSGRQDGIRGKRQATAVVI